MYNLTIKDIQPYEMNLQFSPEKVYIDRYVTLLWFCVGFFGNFCSYIIWIEPKMRRENSSAIYLAALSLNDFMVLAFVLIQDLQYSWNIKLLRYKFCPVYMVLSTCSQLFSPVLVLSFTIERWIAICYPFKRQSLCTPKRAIIVIVLLYIFMLSYNILNGFMWTYIEKTDDCAFHPLNINGTDIGPQYIWTTEVIYSGCVPLLILGFNILVIKEMYRIMKFNGSKKIGNSNQIHDHNQERSFIFTTLMLLVVSFYLFFTSLPVGVMFALQHVITMPNVTLPLSQIPDDPVWKSYFRINIIKVVIDEICISHYALNFVIYLITGKAFRKEFLEKISKVGIKMKPNETSFTNELVSLNKTHRMELTHENSLEFSHSNDGNCQRRNRLLLKDI